jgi:hypothetical protein
MVALPWRWRQENMKNVYKPVHHYVALSLKTDNKNLKIG